MFWYMLDHSWEIMEIINIKIKYIILVIESEGLNVLLKL